MEIKTFADLIDWTRQLHGHLARCLQQSASRNPDERASLLLEYLSRHEAILEKGVAEYERQADSRALETRLYDYGVHKPIKTDQSCDTRYDSLDFDGVAREIFQVHKQVCELYDNLITKAEIREAKTLLEDLLAMHEHEAMRLSGQIGRINDL
ncbi:MAG TPA: ATPase [Marinobacter sp.]|nr:ATPase [Marinobacter sp.]